MKQIKKFLTLFLLMTVLSMLPVIQSFAASETPANVTKLTAKAASETSIKLTWKKAKKADGYIVYLVNNETGALKRIATTKSLSYTAKKLTVGKTYTYQVFAYNKTKKKTYKSEQGSPKATVTLKLNTPAQVTGLKVYTYGDRQVKLWWNKAKNATGYYVYQYKESKGGYVKIGTTSSRPYTVKKLEDGETYRFKVVAYRKKAGLEKVGKESSVLKVTAKAYSKLTKQVQGKRHSATVRSNTTATVIKTKKTIKIKKGTKIYTTSRSTSGMVNAYMKNGTKIKIKGSRLSYGNIQTTKKYYSKAVKEAFINDKGYTSQTSWLIWISQYTLNVNVFKRQKGEWVLKKSMPCVVGKNGATPSGTFKLCNRDYAYGGPRLYFTFRYKDGEPYGNSFHNRVDGHTRAAVSHGCVRLGSSDLHYIANNCPMGTRVVSY